MKKSIFSLAFVVLGLSGFAGTAAAQRYEARVVAPRVVISRGTDSRLSANIERLNRRLREVRTDLRIYNAGKRLRVQFFQTERATSRLNEQFRRGIGNRREMRIRPTNYAPNWHGFSAISVTAAVGGKVAACQSNQRKGVIFCMENRR